LAQLKFTPKHRARDVAQVLERAIAVAALKYEAIPEQLHVKEINVTKGKTHRKVRIMGRGRAGVGTMRWSHLYLSVEVINFDEKISKCLSPQERALWVQRKTLVDSLKANPPSYVVRGKKPSGRRVRVPEEEDLDGEEAKSKK
jgi:hypothetical protein